MDLTRPFADVLTGARGRVIAAIIQSPSSAATVRQIAIRAESSPQGTLDVVNDLAESGIVRTVRSGRSLHVVLNEDHLAAEPLRAIVRTRLRLVDRLTAYLADWSPALDAAWLFGSAARGDGDRQSDVDLLLVALALDDPAWEERTDELRTDVERWTGNTAELVEHDRDSFATLVRSRNPLVDSLRADGIALTPDARRRLRALS